LPYKAAGKTALMGRYRRLAEDKAVGKMFQERNQADKPLYK
jgi:hypothetical protein